MALDAVAVFCGSRFGTDSRWTDLAATTGRRLAELGVTVVYGGGNVGLMGVVANAALEAGGDVIGVIPHQLDARELSHPGLTELHVVDDMHQRKALMAERSDAFITLPGGAGTLEEVTEQWTWAQLGIHAKPAAFLDTTFWAPMRELVNRMVESGFVVAGQPSIPWFGDDVDRAIAELERRCVLHPFDPEDLV